MTSKSNETELSNVWRYLSGKNYITAILTAFHGAHDAHGNRARLLALAAAIRQLGHGFVFLEGHWLDRDASKPEQYEAGMAVSAHISNTHAFINDIRKIVERYEQEAVVISDQTSARLMLRDGTEQKLGVILPGKLGEVYSLIRNEKRTFIFDNEQVDPGFMGRLAGRKPLSGMDNPRRSIPGG